MCLGSVVRRSELLKLTGLSVTSFNSLALRGQLPFERSDTGAQKWATYDAREAIMLALAIRVAEFGPNLVNAALFVRRVFDEYHEAMLSQPRDGGDVFLGFAKAGGFERDPRTLAQELWLFEAPFIGRMDQLADWTARARSVGEVRGFLMVNASDCIREILQRAEIAELSEALQDEVRAAWGLEL